MRKEQEELVLENLGLVKHCAKKFEENNLIQYEDMISIGTIGLIKASETFVEGKGASFATYSCTCIENEIRMALRKERKHDGMEVSLQEPISVDNDGKELLMEEIIHDSSSNFVQQMEEQMEECIAIENIVEFALNKLSGKKRIAVLYSMAGKTQERIAENTGWSQSYISRIWKKFIKDFKRGYKEDKSEDYLIRFSLKETPSEKGDLIPEFTIEYKQNRIWITVFSRIEGLESIASIIQEINEFNFWI